jgi:asparagine synthase (glutamine-hydrolysing)
MSIKGIVNCIMCGITGFMYSSVQSSAEELSAIATRMSDSLSHRGPDDSGVFSDPEFGVALGHRRLSILDLSEQGQQPMISADGRYVLVYNGEIYNYQELQTDLNQKGVRFRSHSDTEVLLEAIAAWGMRETLDRLNGMFAFAIWDRKERQLTLVRDRLGIKPLYYGWFGSCFLFGSELKSLRQHPSFQGKIDRNALALFLENGYIVAPHSIYQRVSKLRPGHYLTVSPGSSNSCESSSQPQCWWSLRDVIERAGKPTQVISYEEKLDMLRERLSDSVRRRLVADVPVGTFLSGGIDSSLVTALAQQVSSNPVKAFTIGFQEAKYDESKHAQRIADHLGVEHVMRQVTAAEARDVIPQLSGMYDEPFADSSQIPTHLVSRIARKEVTVCLSGDGGDELFCGYDRYPYIDRIRRKIVWLPQSVRAPLARMYRRIRSRLRRRNRTSSLLEQVCSTRSDWELYSILNRHWEIGGEVVIGGDSNRVTTHLEHYWSGERSFMEAASAFDAVTYLPDDILTKVDRASMAIALEARTPVLDHRVVELAWMFSFEDKFHHGSGKHPLRAILNEFVPRELFNRPKMGFGIPLGDWLRGPLREWAEDLLSEERLLREGWFNPRPIRVRWEEHLNGKLNWQYPLWNVLMFQAWLQEQT